MTPGVVVVLVEHVEGRPQPGAADLLASSRGVADAQGWPVHAAWVGHGPDDDTVTLLASHGADVVEVVDVEGADPALAASLAVALASVVEGSVGARLVLLPSTFEGREVAARLGVTTGAGVVTGAASVAVEAGAVVVTKPVLAGSWETRCAVDLEGAGGTAVVTLAAHGASSRTGPVAAPGAGHGVVVRHRCVTAPAEAAAVQVVSRERRAHDGGPSLADAEVVVVGGRGTDGDFTGVADLADALGGAVGATRVATDEGWVPRDLQVGQTGVTISPRLYVGAGVSGAVHHRGGMDASGTVVAVNSDPDAPIFEFADVAVVGDLAQVLPALAAEVRARRGAAQPRPTSSREAT